MMRGATTAIAALLLLVASVPAAAQDGPAFRPRRLSVSFGTAVTTTYPVGDVTATLRRNSLGTPPPPYTLLQAESELERGIGLDGRLAFALTRELAIEAAGGFSRPNLAVRVSQDPEAGSDVSIAEQIEQYTVDVSAIYQLPITFGRRARLYAIGGGGYLRQLHEGRLLVETGQTVHAGAGVQYWWRGGVNTRRPIGARAEARWVRRTGGIEFADEARSFAAVHLLFVIGL